MAMPAPEPVKHRIVLTGATGGLGRAILAELKTRSDCSVLALVRDSTRVPLDFPNLKISQVDFADLKRIEELVQAFQPTAFIHSAATGMQRDCLPSLSELRECNVTMSVRLCEFVARISNCRFVFVGSGLAYRDQGRPLREDDPLLLEAKSPYAVSKAEADMEVQKVAVENAMPLVVVRPFSFSGVGDKGTRLFPALLEKADKKEQFKMESGENVRSYCAVQDIARGVLLATISKSIIPNQKAVFNLGSDKTESLRILIEEVVAELQLNVRLDIVPRTTNPQFLVADTSRAQTQLGWRPQINFAHAIWQLAQSSFPSLKLREPRRNL